MTTTALLVELRTEELPPKALPRLGRAFSEALNAELARDNLLDDGSASRWFASPRRLAVRISAVRAVAADRPLEVQGPSVKAGLDSEGRPTGALQGFARKNNVTPDALEQRDTPKGRVFFFKGIAKGVSLDDVLAAKVAAALKSLPIPKMMRWGAGEAEFVRPVHGLVMLHGERVVPGQVLGLDSTRVTYGHRFLGSGRLEVRSADDYERLLREDGAVLADFAERRGAVAEGLARAAGDASFTPDPALLDEVTALTEYPVVYEGQYNPAFLEVPAECLVLSMKQHQKYFPLVDPQSGQLLPRFLVVSNLKTDDTANIVSGNERVLRARLSDARFFYDQDRKTPLASRVPQLAQVVYHNRLGSQLERVERISRLSAAIAGELGEDVAAAERTARLAKADLLAGMVGEFPELQGVMGRYYALHDGESHAIADAIEDHYRPRFAGDALPASTLGCTVALADKLEALTGLFGIGQLPTGDKDPFALRRQALGVIRILVERTLPVELTKLLEQAFGVFASQTSDASAHDALVEFLYERMRGYFTDSGYSVHEVDAVLALRPSRLDLIPRQLEAVRLFNALPEAPSLAAANKRIGNILKKVEALPAQFDPALLVEVPEKRLAEAFARTRERADSHYEAQNYPAMLQALAALKEPVDAFFDGVMVMTDDTRLRTNRLALLAALQSTMNRVADLSRLAR